MSDIISHNPDECICGETWSNIDCNAPFPICEWKDEERIE